MPEMIEDLFFLDLDSRPICLVPRVEYEAVKTVISRLKYDGPIERRHLLREVSRKVPKPLSALSDD